MEAGVLLDIEGKPIHWHVPEGRTAASLPDSRVLWQIIWWNRKRVGGFAHTHPGKGVPGPSYTDVTTFSAIEIGLGRPLLWPILSEDDGAMYRHEGPGKYHYTRCPQTIVAEWADLLRKLTRKEGA
jgi:hypothetical protein